MMPAIAAALAIVVQDHTALRAGAQSTATELTTLSQGDVLEIRGERAGYLQVYNYRRERGGYLRDDAVRPLSLNEHDAPDLLAVLRFLGETRGSEALGISYGAAYIQAVPAPALTAEPLLTIARMAERLADSASGNGTATGDIGAHLDVAAQSGIRMRSFEHDGHIQVCYDGALFQRVMTMPGAGSEQRALAALSLTRPDCIDPSMSPTLRGELDRQRAAVLDGIADRDLTALTRSRLHARRAAVWAALAFEQARHGGSSQMAGQRALSEILDVAPNDLGSDGRAEYLDALARVSASRWAAATPSTSGRPALTVTAGDPGQTCISLQAPQRATAPLVQRCTYGIPWMASAQAIAQGQAVVLAVQPLPTWRELWIFHKRGGAWVVDVLPPGYDDPDLGYIEYAGYASATDHLLIVREVKVRGRLHRSFEELRFTDLVTVRQASSPALLRDFRCQDAIWRRDTLSLH